MSRLRDDGLKYFPLVTDFFEDKRIRRLASRFGADGPLFYLYILCKAYRNSYFVKADDDFLDDAALDLNCSTEKIGLMLHYLLDKSLLDSKLFSTVKVLSSHGIQTQYQESKKGLRRDIGVDANSWILNDDETREFIKVRQNADKFSINSDKSGINADKSEKKALNKNKLNKRESKTNEEAYASCPEPETDSGPPVFALPLNDGTDYLIFRCQVQEWSELYPAVDVMQQLRNMKGWLIGNPERKKTKKGIARFITGWLAKEQNRGGATRNVNKRSGQGNELLAMIERGDFGD